LTPSPVALFPPLPDASVRDGEEGDVSGGYVSYGGRGWLSDTKMLASRPCCASQNSPSEIKVIIFSISN